MKEQDLLFMKKALDEAISAQLHGDIPVGAVIVRNGEIIASGHNNRELINDATAHAEIVAIRNACQKLNSWHLDNCILYVTLEPCPMCMGAIVNSRIERVVFGAKDSKAGSCGSLLNLCAYPVNHKPLVTSGVLEEECGALLSEFFKNKR